MRMGNEGDGNITVERKVWRDQGEGCGRWGSVNRFEPSLTEVNGTMGHSAMAITGTNVSPPEEVWPIV